MKKILAADLFCGAGGASTGLVRACRIVMRLKQASRRLRAQKDTRDIRARHSECAGDLRPRFTGFAEASHVLGSAHQRHLASGAFGDARDRVIGTSSFDGQVRSNENQEAANLVQSPYAPINLLLMARARFSQRRHITEAQTLLNRVDGVEVGVDDRRLDADSSRPHVNAAFAIKESAKPRVETVVRPILEVVHAGALVAHIHIVPLQPHELAELAA